MTHLLSMFGPYRRITPELAASYGFAIYQVKKDGSMYKYADRLAKTAEAAQWECDRMKTLNPTKSFTFVTTGEVK